MLYRLDKDFLFEFSKELETIVELTGTNNIERYSEDKLIQEFKKLLVLIIGDHLQIRIIVFGLLSRFSSTKKKC